MRASLTILALILPAVALATPQHATVPWVDHRPPPRGTVALQRSMLDGHNRARAAYGVAPLAWDDGLARSARAYAQALARSGRFEHARQEGRVPQGENLWMGTRNAYRFAEMIGHWVDEKRFYRPGIFPNVSRTSDWSVVAHYTQVIWPATRQVGCATASNARDDYLVCRYLPAGNVVGTRLR